MLSFCACQLSSNSDTSNHVFRHWSVLKSGCSQRQRLPKWGKGFSTSLSTWLHCPACENPLPCWQLCCFFSFLLRKKKKKRHKQPPYFGGLSAFCHHYAASRGNKPSSPSFSSVGFVLLRELVQALLLATTHLLAIAVQRPLSLYSRETGYSPELTRMHPRL